MGVLVAVVAVTAVLVAAFYCRKRQPRVIQAVAMSVTLKELPDISF